MTITIHNRGPAIASTDYWTSDLARAGKVYCSTNGGTVRVLLPDALHALALEMRGAEYCILSRGPWNRRAAVEILWEDHSDAPIALQLTDDSFDLVPGEPDGDPDEGRTWRVSAWVEEDGAPRMIGDWDCHWRRVAELPCLLPLKTAPQGKKIS